MTMAEINKNRFLQTKTYLHSSPFRNGSSPEERSSSQTTAAVTSNTHRSSSTMSNPEVSTVMVMMVEGVYGSDGGDMVARVMVEVGA